MSSTEDGAASEPVAELDKRPTQPPPAELNVATATNEPMSGEVSVSTVEVCGDDIVELLEEDDSELTASMADAPEPPVTTRPGRSTPPRGRS